MRGPIKKEYAIHTPFVATEKSAGCARRYRSSNVNECERDWCSSFHWAAIDERGEPEDERNFILSLSLTAL